MVDGNGGPLFGDLDYKGKILEIFYYSICLSYFSSLNFYGLSVDCVYNFSTKFSFVFILEIKNDENLFVKNENEESKCYLLVT